MSQQPSLVGTRESYWARALREATSLKLPELHVSRIAFRARTYEDVRERRSQLAQWKKAAEKVERASSQLLAALEAYEKHDTSLHVGWEVTFFTEEQLAKRLPSAQLEWLRDQARASKNDVGALQRPGRRSNAALRELAAAALAAYHAIGGHGIGVSTNPDSGERQGPVFNIVKAALGIAKVQDVPHDNTIRTAIQDASQ